MANPFYCKPTTSHVIAFVGTYLFVILSLVFVWFFCP